MTSNLLKKLAKDPAKKSVGSIKIRVLKWLLICLFYIVMMVALVGLRKDYLKVCTTYQFWADVVSLLGVIITSSIICFKLATPGNEKKLNLKSMFIPVAIWLISNIIIFILNKSFYIETAHTIFSMCFGEIMVLSIVPLVILFNLSIKLEVRYKKYFGLSTFLASSGVCALAIQFSCPNSNPIHILFSHILPVILFTYIGTFVFRKILK
ncbi:MAG: DUF1109 domain-containing protein [Bacteriovoracaceae bacterium]|jgi:hypothetical protein|nr:DUF1109 domain-containing protein [Bacteriovoracaceae bacterium]